MKVSERLESRRGSWQELERLCGRMEAQWRKKPPAQAVARFASLYRSACADLALADAYNLPPATIAYLHQLVARAHNQLYRTRTFQLNKWRHTLFVDVPRQLYSDLYLRLAMLLFWGIFLIGMLLAWREPEFAFRVAGKANVISVEEQFSDVVFGSAADEDAYMGGFYTKHNATIGLRCFAYGMLYGVGGLLETAMNAAIFGTLFGYMLHSPNHAGFFTFVTAHSSFELTAIVLMAAAGMRLGFSMIDTQGRSRSDSLRHAAGQIVPIMSVGVILFLFAATIESFVSHSTLPYWGRAAVAIISAMLLFVYIVVLGYRGETAARTAPAQVAGAQSLMLDNYRIAVRERKLFEQMDLTLRLIREHAAPLAVALLVGMGPFFLLNTWLFSLGAWSDLDSHYPYFPMLWMAVLIAWELPLATAPATLYLGQALFDARPKPRRIAGDFLKSLGQLIFYEMFLRGIGLLFFGGFLSLCQSGFHQMDAPTFFEKVQKILMNGIALSCDATCLIPFVIRPYLIEIILLERNPFSAGRKGRMSTGRRASAMHQGMGGDFFYRWLATSACTVLLLASIWLSLETMAGLLWNDWSFDGPFYWLFYPLALWIVAAWLTVLRFLGYLDLRIRREGWEVELLMRAEATRWAYQSA